MRLKSTKSCLITPLLKKCVRASIKAMCVTSTVLAFGLGVLAIDFYQRLDFLKEIPQCQMVKSTARNLVLFCLTGFYTCLAGACFFDGSSFKFKVTLANIFALLLVVSMSVKSNLANSVQHVDREMAKHFSRYYTSGDSKLIVDAIQSRHECCGYESAKEFPKYRRLPLSCCPLPSVKKHSKCLKSKIHKNSCRFDINAHFALQLPSLDFLLFMAATTLMAQLSLVVFSLIFFDDEVDAISEESTTDERIETLGAKVES